jgi:aspartyl-tRNA(Asn)/glutamyl-tRNA(Gln) amidotransferase subunit A
MLLNQLTIKEASEKLWNKEISSVDLTRACLKQIKASDKRIKALITLIEKEALLSAKLSDERLAKGERGALLGIPYLARDILMTKGIKTTAASKMLENYIAPYDATVIDKLNKAGAVLLGKTNLDEFAHGSSTENSAFFTTHNPWDIKRVPGGSSGGSAASVISDYCLFALGSDTGGSIRQPASFCSVVGIKPSYGRVSRHGLLSMTSSTDVIGPLTKTVEDGAIVLKIIAGSDDFDSTAKEVEVSDYEKEIKTDLVGMKIALPKEFFGSELDKGVKKILDEAISELKKLGVEFFEVSLPHIKYSIPVYYIITPSELSSNLARFDGLRYGHRAKIKKTDTINNVYLNNRGEGFGPEAKRRIMLGTFALSAGYFDAYYKKAQEVRRVITDELEEVLEKYDAIIAPATVSPAFKIGEKAKNPLSMYLEDTYLAGVSLSGHPAISVPAGFVDGLPVGMQIISKRFKEDTMLKIAKNFESVTPWHKMRPKK